MRTFIFSLAALLAALPTLAQADQTSQARALSSHLVQQLGAALKKELAANGPEGAISVCRDVAPAIAGELSRRSGNRVARVSLKPRNALLGEPDEWEQRVLAEFDRRAASGENPDTLEFAETVTEPRGRYFRFMKALPVQPLCLTCHGTAENISDRVRQKLANEYPRDRATGYQLGQVRGAITIKQPLDGAD